MDIYGLFLERGCEAQQERARSIPISPGKRVRQKDGHAVRLCRYRDPGQFFQASPKPRISPLRRDELSINPGRTKHFEDRHARPD